MLPRLHSSLLCTALSALQCFLLSGEHRRCLATLQHKGLLQVTVIGPLGDALRPGQRRAAPPPSTDNSDTSFLTPVQRQHLAGLHMAASCLHHLQEHEDCLALLESLLHLENSAAGDQAAARALRLLPNQASEIHVMAGE
jgi:hypothetical protein